MAIYVSGSLAYDRIMTFSGNFKDHVLMDKLHMLNISFMVDNMEERNGGCAGNIAYSLALLGEFPIIVSSAGRDFNPYAKRLEKLGLDLSGITIQNDLFTALCYITTDLSGNQITGFYPGAMTKPSDYNFPRLDPEKDIAIVSPGNVEDMLRLPEFFKHHNVPYIFDPGQQLPVLPGERMRKAIEGAFALITNDYELNMVCKNTGLSEDEIPGKALWLVTTLGAKGARIRGADGTDIIVPSYPVKNVADPTGAGDAQRAGLIKGLAMGIAMPEAARLGSISASFAIEQMGTQEHAYNEDDFMKRYEELFDAYPW